MNNLRTVSEPRYDTKTVIIAALMAAITCIGTMIIKVPTPTNGYIHPGDGFVLLSGLLLGPFWGALAAGIGSGLSDLISGYTVYAPATFAIKGLTALAAYYVFKLLTKVIGSEKKAPALIVSGIAGEVVMVTGYFFFEIFLLAVLNQSSLAAGAIAATAGILPNIVQGAFGVIISVLLYPILLKAIR